MSDYPGMGVMIGMLGDNAADRSRLLASLKAEAAQ